MLKNKTNPNYEVSLDNLSILFLQQLLFVKMNKMKYI
jgi:hypothetical protein